MGLGLWPYRVDLGGVRGFCGSGDGAALAAMKRRLARRLREIDEDFDGDEAPAADALSELCLKKKPKLESVHGAVVEALCTTFGKKLGNPIWERYSTKFFSDLDDELTARGLKRKDALVAIVQSGIKLGNVTLREPECGAMEPEQVARVGGLIDQMDLSALSDDQRQATREIRRWLATAERQGQGFAIFNY